MVPVAMSSSKVLVVLLVAFSINISNSKLFNRCKLAKIFRENFPPEQINDCKKTNKYYNLHLHKSKLNSGICLAEGESRFNSSAVGTTNPDGSKDLGLFQIR